MLDEERDRYRQYGYSNTSTGSTTSGLLGVFEYGLGFLTMSFGVQGREGGFRSSYVDHGKPNKGVCGKWLMIFASLAIEVNDY